MKRLLFITFILIISTRARLAYAADVIDASAMNLTLSPVSLQVVAKPGEAVQREVKIRNNTSDVEHLHVNVGKFRPETTGDRPVLLDTDPSDPSLSWVSMSESNFILNPSEWKTLTVSFAPPSDAAGAEYYTLLFSRADTISVRGATQIQGAPAILMLATIDSPLNKRELTLTHFISSHHMMEFLPAHFSITVKNTGNVHLVPQGNVFIDGQGKKDVAVLSLNPNALAVLPDSSRTYSVDWNDGFPLKEEKEGEKSGTSFLGLRWDWSKGDRFRFGRYTAHLLLVYDNGERDIPIEAVETFWMIPWRLLLICLALLLFVGIGLRSTILTIFKGVRRVVSRSSLPPPSSVE